MSARDTLRSSVARRWACFYWVRFQLSASPVGADVHLSTGKDGQPQTSLSKVLLGSLALASPADKAILLSHSALFDSSSSLLSCCCACTSAVMPGLDWGTLLVRQPSPAIGKILWYQRTNQFAMDEVLPVRFVSQACDSGAFRLVTPFAALHVLLLCLE